MPDFDQPKANDTRDNKETRGGRGEERRTPKKRRTAVGSALNLSGDTTRSQFFNKTLDELFEKKPEVLEWFKYGHVADSTEASINYLGVKTDENEFYVAAVVFESRGTYRRQHDGRESYFTFDLLAKGDELRERLVEAVVADHKIAAEDVYVVDAQIIPTDFKVDEDSVKTVAYFVQTLLDQLSGVAPEDLEIDQFDLYEANFVVNPLNRFKSMYETRTDFSVEVNVGKTRRERWTPSILDTDEVSELGKARIHGMVDLDYTGPAVSPDEYTGLAEAYKPEQFTLKNTITAIELVGENNLYSRGLISLAAMAEMHKLESGREVLEQRVIKDKLTDLNSLAASMWLPRDVIIPKAKKEEDYINLLDKMVYKRESIISFLHRDGDMSSGILHLLSKVGQKQPEYLEVLLAELDNLSPVEDKDAIDSVSNRYARYLGLKSEKELTFDDFVTGYTPRVFGMRRNGDHSYPLEFVDSLQLADITASNVKVYGDMINSVSLIDRRYSAEESKEVQIRFYEELPTDFDGVGAEYAFNAQFIEFLGKEVDAMFREKAYNKFADRRDGFRTYHRTSSKEDRRMIMGSRNEQARYSDRSNSSFGSLRRR